MEAIRALDRGLPNELSTANDHAAARINIRGRKLAHIGMSGRVRVDRVFVRGAPVRSDEVIVSQI
jgi:hypothetical protein